MKTLVGIIIASLLSVFSATAGAQESSSYKNGVVISVSYIKIKPGKFDDYMAFLDSDYKALMEANKKAGLILSYSVFSAQARNPHEADVILTTTFANMAALDRDTEADAVAAKVLGAQTAQNKAIVDRGAMREVLGSELIRELVLK